MKKIILFIIVNCTLLTGNCYSQWVQQTSGVNSPLYNIQFVNINTGWVTGGNSVILKTTDGGINWFSQTIDLGYPKNLYGLSMLDVNTGYIAGWFETILKTTNGGTNWNILSNIPSNTGNSNDGVFFINPQTGWICSALGRVMRTTNGGISWDTSIAGGTLRDIQFLNSQTGWVCGGGGALFESTNGGISWITAPILTAANLTSIYFININTGWTVSEQGRRVFRTTNAGKKWDSVAVLPGGGVDFLYSVYFVNALTGWTGGSNILLFKSTNGGINWIQQYVPAPMYISNLSFYNDTIGWAAGGNNGTIIHTTTGGTYVGINPVSSIVSEYFQLYQNYPNPFNPGTTIGFQIPKSGFVSLKVFDVLGREAAYLINEPLKAGKYEIEWDAGNFSSGLYFYTLIADGKIIDTKKMLLLK